MYTVLLANSQKSLLMTKLILYLYRQIFYPLESSSSAIVASLSVVLVVVFCFIWANILFHCGLYCLAQLHIGLFHCGSNGFAQQHIDLVMMLCGFVGPIDVHVILSSICPSAEYLPNRTKSAL
jgi:hypothetical protein